VCNTRSILEYMETKYSSELNGFFMNHSVDGILGDLKSRDLHQHKISQEPIAASARQSVTRPIPTTQQPTYMPTRSRDTPSSKSMSSSVLHDISYVCRMCSIAVLSTMFLLVSLQNFCLNNLPKHFLVLFALHVIIPCTWSLSWLSLGDLFILITKLTVSPTTIDCFGTCNPDSLYTSHAF